MKKALAIVALIAAMFVAGNVQAQTTIYGVYAPEKFSLSNSSYNFQGFGVGLAQNFVLSKGIGVAVGAQFRMNTRSDSQTYLGVTAKLTETQTLIDVPIMLNYQISINQDIKVSPFVGPIVSLALSGKSTISVGSSERTENWYETSLMNRFNLYAVIGADIKYSHFNLFGGYRIGLLDLDTSDGTLKTNGLFVGLGYTL